MVLDLLPGGNAAIDHDLELWKVLLQPIDVCVLERRHLAVLFRREAFEDGIARVDDEGSAAGCRDRSDKVLEESVILVPVNAGYMLHCVRNADYPPASRNAFPDR